jgi:hypothetical protein
MIRQALIGNGEQSRTVVCHRIVAGYESRAEQLAADVAADRHAHAALELAPVRYGARSLRSSTAGMPSDSTAWTTAERRSRRAARVNER